GARRTALASDADGSRGKPLRSHHGISWSPRGRIRWLRGTPLRRLARKVARGKAPQAGLRQGGSARAVSQEVLPGEQVKSPGLRMRVGYYLLAPTWKQSSAICSLDETMARLRAGWQPPELGITV